MQCCHKCLFRNNVKRTGLGKRWVQSRFRKIHEVYNYWTEILQLLNGNLLHVRNSTGILQLQYMKLTVTVNGNLTVTVRGFYSYSTGILQLQYRNLTCSYSTRSLQMQNSCCWFHPESDHSSCSGLGSCTSGSSFATSTSLTSLVFFRCLFMQMSAVYGGLCYEDVVTKSAHRKLKSSLRFHKVHRIAE